MKTRSKLSLRSLSVLLICFCALSANGQKEFDHQAHAVAGDDVTAYDLNNDGGEKINLDGALSHSHYFSAGPPVVNGYIAQWRWSNPGDGDKTLCTTQKCSPWLSVGAHHLKLFVKDQVGGTAEDHIVVTVKKGSAASAPPELYSVNPSSGTVGGGQTVTLSGKNFYGDATVKFGGKGAAEAHIASTDKIVVKTPSSGAGTVNVVVSTSRGTSWAVKFQFTDSGGSVAFKSTHWKNADGSDFTLAQEISGITMDGSGRYWLSSLLGHVWAVDVGQDNVVRSSCKGAQQPKGRALYDVAWHDKDPNRLFVTVNTMWWKDSGSTWHNAEIEAVDISATKCATRGQKIVTGLPTSNHDHGVSKIAFLPDGTMLFSVGATTNAGVAGAQLGGTDESPLSGAIVGAPYLKEGFNGHVKYSNYNDLKTTDVTSGDVYVYAAGFRNSFGLIRSPISGLVYATDNGANEGFGPASTSCSSQGSDPNVQDSLFVVDQGSYYGHANRNRGRYDGRQCAWRGEGTSSAMASMVSSTSGIMQYTGNAFGGQLKGNLFLSKMAWMGMPGKTFRTQLNGDGRSVAAGPFEIWGDSGLSIIQGKHGDIVMPKLKEKKVMVLLPDEGSGANSGSRFLRGPAVLSVHPPRGKREGGTELLITGRNFDIFSTVHIGGAECLDVKISGSTVLRCRAPARAQHGGVAVVVTNRGLSSPVYGIDFTYEG